ncbi:MAG: hypothetical protein AAFR68_04095 [Pseudomonadota bacterium]
MDFATLGIQVDSRPVDKSNQSLDRLVATGARAERSTNRLVSATDRYGRTASNAFGNVRMASNEMAVMSDRMDTLGRRSIFASGGFRNLGLQMNQIAQVGGMTGNWMQAISVQLPDILLGFGTLGIVLGAAAGAMIPLITNLTRSASSAEAMENRVSELNDAIDAYVSATEQALLPTEKLAERYGTATLAARDFLETLRDIEGARANDALDSSIDVLTQGLSGFDNPLGLSFAEARQELERLSLEYDDLERRIQQSPSRAGRNNLREEQEAIAASAQELQVYEDQILQIERALNITGTEVALLADGLADLAAAEGVEAQVDAARELNELLITMFGSWSDMPPAVQLLFEELNRTALKASELEASIQDNVGAAVDFNSALSGASPILGGLVNDAGALWQNMTGAANAAFAFLQQRATVAAVAQGQFGSDAARDQVQGDFFNSGLRRDAIVSQTIIPAQTASGGGRRRGGGGGGGTSEASRQQQEDLREAERLFRETRTSAEEYAIELENLNRLYKEGDIDQDVYQRALGDLKEEFEDVGSLADDVRSAFRGFLDGVFDDPQQALENLGKQLAELALQTLLFRGLSSALPGVFGAGGFLQLPSFDGGGNTGNGSRTGGVDGRGGFPAILHPNETVIDHTRRQGMPAGNNVEVNIIGAPEGTRTSRRKGPDGRDIIDVQVGKAMAQGSYDQSLQARTGLTPQIRRR